MTFELFEKNLSKIKNIALPGQASQFKMSPPFRQELVEKYRDKIKFAKKAGVMAMFYPDEAENCKLCLILRKTYKGVHSAQVGFPGGKVEKGDRNLADTAIRETEEEVGISRTDITLVREMTDIYIPPSNFVVRPYIGTTDSQPKYVIQEDEVEAIIEVNLDEFLDDNSIEQVSVMTSLKTELEVPAFILNGHVVWGATAMMLGEIKDLLITALNSD